MKRLAVLTAACIVGLTSVAAAHVTIQPNEAPAGAFYRFVVRVPNERGDAQTTKVKVTFPNLVFVSFQPKDGWKHKVTMRKLDEPIEVFGTKYDEVIDTVTWSGGDIGVGEFDEFGFSARVPDEAGSIEFKAEQTYSSGEVVSWAGAPDSEEPAPLVNVVGLEAEEGQGPLAIIADVQKAVALQDEMMDSMHAGGAVGDTEDDDSPLPLVLGGLGSVLGAAALGLTLGRKKA